VGRTKRTGNKWLTAATVKNEKRLGLHADGANLYLQVGKAESAAGSINKSWIFRFRSPETGKSRDMGLGAVVDISLAKARELASAARLQLIEDIDPLEWKKAERARKKIEGAKAITFQEAATKYIQAHRAGWRSAVHAAQWEQSLCDYAFPIIGDLPVSAIDTALVMRVLEAIWTEKTETASRVRGRIELVLDWARVHGYRTGENPARWRGHLDHLLPARVKVSKVAHHPAMPYVELPAFLVDLRKRPGIGACALEFAILTAARSGEVLGARWDEIDLDAATWTIPGTRMKAGNEHRVPLAQRALDILQEMKRLNGNFIFPGRDRRALSNGAIPEVLLRMKKGNVTPHGFRSSFRDWAAEQTSFPSEVVEMALAHAVGSRVENAYRRTDLFDRRRRLMDAWADYCSKPATGGAVIPIRRTEIPA
jgi:integrase